MQASKMETVTIKVDETNNSVSVDKEDVVLIKKNNDKVKWEVQPKKFDFVVGFDQKTPFEKKFFTKNFNSSKRITIEPEGGEERFKYIVEIPELEISLDPGIIIRRTE